MVRQQEKNSWASNNEQLFLVMANTGGHGTDNAIKQYTSNLGEVYNIEIIHQVLGSPFTNVVDLGVWVALQASVKYFY